MKRNLKETIRNLLRLRRHENLCGRRVRTLERDVSSERERERERGGGGGGGARKYLWNKKTFYSVR